VNFNVPGANFIYTGGTNNDTMVVNVDNVVWLPAAAHVLSGESDFTFNVSGGAGNDAITFNLIDSSAAQVKTPCWVMLEAWYTNQVLNANVTINGGAGNDTIRTPGAGNIIINGDDGNDVIYTDNVTGAMSGRRLSLQRKRSGKQQARIHSTLGV
jgi:Ca2+-binding RTX toxin-like protein